MPEDRRAADDDGGAVGLTRKSNHLGMTRFTKDDNLSVHRTHLVIAFPDSLLQGQHDRAGGIHKFNIKRLGSTVGLGRLTVGPDKHFLPA